MSGAEIVKRAAAILDGHSVRDFDIGGWTCMCGPDERTDDPSMHFAYALQEAGLLTDGMLNPLTYSSTGREFQPPSFEEDE